MTLDEAIKHAEEVAETKEKQIKREDWEKGSLTEESCIACAEEHRQLAEWLKDYKRLLEQEPKTGYCKDCKYFEYDSVAKVDGIPLIVAHEICNKRGDGCKSKEDGYCFLFEPQESETWNGIHAQITAPKGTFERIFTNADDDCDV